MPKRREDIIEQATMEPEGPVRRDIELALSAVGKEGPTEDSRAVRTLKERWIIQELEDLDVINVESPGKLRTQSQI